MQIDGWWAFHASRPPAAFRVMAGIAVLLGMFGFPMMGLYTLLCVGAYLRPGEGIGLRGVDLILPVARAYRVWSLLVKATELDLPTKT